MKVKTKYKTLISFQIFKKFDFLNNSLNKPQNPYFLLQPIEMATL